MCFFDLFGYYKEFPRKKISQLTANEIRMLSKKEIESINPIDIRLFSPKQIQSFQRSQLQMLTEMQLKNLTAQQVLKLIVDEDLFLQWKNERLKLFASENRNFWYHWTSLPTHRELFNKYVVANDNTFSKSKINQLGIEKLKVMSLPIKLKLD